MPTKPAPIMDVAFGLRIPPEELLWIDVQAEAEGRTRSGMVRRLLAEARAAREEGAAGL